MATTEERLKVLKMLEEGKISSEDAARLLKTLSRTAEAGPPRAAEGEARWMRVRVTDKRSGKSTVNVNLPVDLVNVGLRIGAHFVPEMDAVDMEEVFQALRQGMTGKIVDVDDEEERVEVYLE